MSKGTKVTVIDDEIGSIIEEYTMTMMVNKKALLEEAGYTIVHSEVLGTDYEKYWVKK